MNQVMKIVLLNEKPMSWNKLYSGQHWSKRHAEAMRVHMLMRLETLNIKNKFKNKVKVILTGYFKDSPLDADNIASKLYIDGLRHNVLVDDTLEWIDSVTTKSRIDKVKPRLEIEIIEL